MAITNDTQDVTTTAAPLGAGSGGRRRLLIVRNPVGSGATIYLGGPDVDDDNASFVLAEGDPPLVFTSSMGDSLAGETWHAVTASGTATGVAVTED